MMTAPARLLKLAVHRLRAQRNDIETSTLPQTIEREPIPERSSGDSHRARYRAVQPAGVRSSTPAQASPST